MKCVVKFVPVILAVFCACACLPEVGLVEIASENLVPPEYVDMHVQDARTLIVEFDSAVQAVSVAVQPEVSTITTQADGASIVLGFEEDLAAGALYHVDMVVEDEYGNTLSVILPFRGKNDRMPQLLLTELRTEYSKPKVEFIEFLCLEAGNLGALRLISPDAGVDAPLFEFPPCEVAEGEYVVVHLRNLDDLGVDELENCDASAGTEAHSEARDFWKAGVTKNLRKSDGVALIDQDGVILDAVILNESAASSWRSQDVADFAEMLVSEAAWKTLEEGSSTITAADAVLSQYTTVTRTICRDGYTDTDSASDWYITNTSCATPGQPNNPARYSTP